MSQSNDQRTQAMEKVSELGEQIDLGGDDLSNVFDELRSGDLRAQQLASLGETVGQQGGALLGRRIGEAIGQKFADENGTLSFSSIVSTLRSSGSEDSEGSEGNQESETESEEAEGEGENQGDGESEEGSGDETEIEGDGSGNFEDMSDDELQDLANDLMGELEQRQANGS